MAYCPPANLCLDLGTLDLFAFSALLPSMVGLGWFWDRAHHLACDETPSILGPLFPQKKKPLCTCFYLGYSTGQALGLRHQTSLQLSTLRRSGLRIALSFAEFINQPTHSNTEGGSTKKEVSLMSHRKLPLHVGLSLKKTFFKVHSSKFTIGKVGH